MELTASPSLRNIAPTNSNVVPTNSDHLLEQRETHSPAITQVEGDNLLPYLIRRISPHDIDSSHHTSIEQITTHPNTPTILDVAGLTAGSALVALLLLHPGGALTVLPLLGASATGGTAVAAATTASIGASFATPASLLSILSAGASVVIPFTALSIGAHEFEHWRHTLSRNFTSIASAVLATEITLHPSIGTLLTSGLHAMVTNPLTTTTILVVGGLLAADHSVPHYHQHAEQEEPQHVEGTLLRRAGRTTSSAITGYLIATHPDSIGILVNNTLHILGGALAAVVNATTTISTPAGTSSLTAPMLGSSLATHGATSITLPAAASALVPHSTATVASIAAHASIPWGAAATISAIAAHPIAITVGLATGACMLAKNLSHSSESTSSEIASAPTINSEASQPSSSKVPETYNSETQRNIRMPRGI